jgi:hypothetical protein
MSSLGEMFGGTSGVTGAGPGGMSAEAMSPELIAMLQTPELGLDAGVTLGSMGPAEGLPGLLGQSTVGQVSTAAPGGAVPVSGEIAAGSGLSGTGGVGAGDYARWAKRAYDIADTGTAEEEPPPPPPIYTSSEPRPRQPLQPVDLEFAEFLERVKRRGMGRTGIIGIESL